MSETPAVSPPKRSAFGAVLSSLVGDVGSPASDFVVVIMRHGERFQDKGITGLAPDGQHRAVYLSRCASAGQPTTALPFGAPTIVASSAVRPGESTRPRDTMLPLAKALGLVLDQSVDKYDYDGFARLVQHVLNIGQWFRRDLICLPSHLEFIL